MAECPQDILFVTRHTGRVRHRPPFCIHRKGIQLGASRLSFPADDDNPIEHLFAQIQIDTFGSMSAYINPVFPHDNINQGVNQFRIQPGTEHVKTIGRYVSQIGLGNLAAAGIVLTEKQDTFFLLH